MTRRSPNIADGGLSASSRQQREAAERFHYERHSGLGARLHYRLVSPLGWG